MARLDDESILALYFVGTIVLLGFVCVVLCGAKPSCDTVQDRLVPVLLVVEQARDDK